MAVKKKRYFSKDVCIGGESDGGNNWTSGSCYLDGTWYNFETKHFEEPSQFGIQNGRISKLLITDENNTQRIAYERGWCYHWKKADAKMQAVYRAILKKYN